MKKLLNKLKSLKLSFKIGFAFVFIILLLALGCGTYYGYTRYIKSNTNPTNSAEKEINKDSEQTNTNQDEAISQDGQEETNIETENTERTEVGEITITPAPSKKATTPTPTQAPTATPSPTPTAVPVPSMKVYTATRDLYTIYFKYYSTLGNASGQYYAPGTVTDSGMESVSFSGSSGSVVQVNPLGHGSGGVEIVKSYSITSADGKVFSFTLLHNIYADTYTGQGTWNGTGDKSLHVSITNADQTTAENAAKATIQSLKYTF